MGGQRRDTPDDHSPFVVRKGEPDEGDLLVELFDSAVAWLVERGFSAQWGVNPFSRNADRIASCRKWAAEGDFYVCEIDRQPVAAVVLGDAPDYVPPTDEAEVYVNVLVSSHLPRSRGAGAHLLATSYERARLLGVQRLRVDCFAGNGGGLVRFYESCGYRRVEPFMVRDWPGQILELRLEP